MDISKDFINKVTDVLEIIKSPDVSEALKNEALRSVIDHITYEKENQNLAIFYYI